MIKKYFLFFSLIALMLPHCTVIKRKYTGGYYCDFKKPQNRVSEIPSENILIAQKYNHNKTAILHSGIHKENICKDNLIAVKNEHEKQPAKTLDRSLNHQFKYHHFKKTNQLTHYTVSKPEQPQNSNKKATNDEEYSSPKKSLYKIIAWSVVNLLIFILIYSLWYNHYIEMITTLAILIYGIFPSLILIPLSITATILSFIQYAKIIKNPESTKTQKILSLTILILSILLHPIMVFLYFHLIIII